MQSSRPYFDKIRGVNNTINELKAEREQINKDMAPTKKIINSLRDKITAVKKEESVFDNAKQLKQYDLTNISSSIEKNLEQQRAHKKKKYDLKEEFYGRMCDYEIQQALIKDIEWIEKTKEMVLERTERNEKYKQERKEREEHRKKLAEERDRVKAEIRAK